MNKHIIPEHDRVLVDLPSIGDTFDILEIPENEVDNILKLIEEDQSLLEDGDILMDKWYSEVFT